MANENIEKSAANAMSGSHTGGRGAVRDWIKTVWGNRQLTGGGSSSSSSSSSSSKGNDSGRPAFTGEEIDNYNRYLSHHYGLQNELEKNRGINTTDIMDRAVAHGQMASIDFNHAGGRHQISFAETPPSQTNPGNGPGGQGGSRQQSQPGGRGSRGPAVYETRHIEANAKDNPTYKGTTRTQNAWAKLDQKERRDIAATYITKGKNLTPAQKSQNAAARSYMTPFDPKNPDGKKPAAKKGAVAQVDAKPNPKLEAANRKKAFSE